MRRARRSSTGRAAAATATTPVKASPKRKRRVVFAEEPEDVRFFDKRDPVGEDFHAFFAEDPTGSPPSEDTSSISVMQPLTTAADVQTTPQKFSLHEFVLSLFFSHLDVVVSCFHALRLLGNTRLAGRVEVAMDTETMTRAELQSALVLHGLNSRGTKAQLKVCQALLIFAAASRHFQGACLRRFRHAWSSTSCSRVRRTGKIQRPEALRHEKEGKRSTRVKQQPQSGCSGDDVCNGCGCSHTKHFLKVKVELHIKERMPRICVDVCLLWFIHSAMSSLADSLELPFLVVCGSEPNSEGRCGFEGFVCV